MFGDDLRDSARTYTYNMMQPSLTLFAKIAEPKGKQTKYFSDLSIYLGSYLIEICFASACGQYKSLHKIIRSVTT